VRSDLSHYSAAHRAELAALLETEPWREVLASGLVAEVAASRLLPSATRGFTDTVVERLTALNGARLRQLLAQGCRDAETLFEALARWPDDLDPHALRLSFLGLNVTPHCNIEPRCQYCNQPDTEHTMSPDDWKRIVDEAAAVNGEHGAYVYITGGEPLLLGEALWGDAGLVAYTTARGNSVNVNTNGTLLTPKVALWLIKAGTARLHISLDSSDRAVQNALYGGDWYDRVLQGIYNVQLARELLGVTYPGIHLNCVLTRRNLDSYPELFAFALDKHAAISDKRHPLFTDLFPHTIPVGGDENDALRPTAEDFERFYTQIWPQVVDTWRVYQERIGVPEADRAALPGYFLNPWLRVRHGCDLAEYARLAAQGRYAVKALSTHCYVAPTQASFAPDGEQYRCGWHAIARWLPVGNVHRSGVLESIRDGLEGLGALPWEQYCDGCSLATLYINQQVEARLREVVQAALGGAQTTASAELVDPA